MILWNSWKICRKFLFHEKLNSSSFRFFFSLAPFCICFNNSKESQSHFNLMLWWFLEFLSNPCKTRWCQRSMWVFLLFEQLTPSERANFTISHRASRIREKYTILRIQAMKILFIQKIAENSLHDSETVGVCRFLSHFGLTSSTSWWLKTES